jgi:hypothetical protein
MGQGPGVPKSCRQSFVSIVIVGDTTARLTRGPKELRNTGIPPALAAKMAMGEQDDWHQAYPRRHYKGCASRLAVAVPGREASNGGQAPLCGGVRQCSW